MLMAAASRVLHTGKTSIIDGEVGEERGHTWGGPQGVGFLASSVPSAQEPWALDEWASEVVWSPYAQLLVCLGLTAW